jgi:hypothetical protein
MKRPHNKTLLAQAAPAGTGYCVVRPKAGRYGASESLLSTQSGHSISPVQQSDSVKIVLRDKR